LLQQQFEPPSRLVRFFSREDILKYLKSLVENYQRESEKYGDRLGVLMRADSHETSKVEAKGKAPSKGWMKMGNLMVNVSDSRGATTEVTYQIHEDLKQRVASATTALNSFEQGASAIIPETSVYLLYLKNGMPERIIAENPKKKETFSFAANYKVV